MPSAPVPPRFQPAFAPQADPASIIQVGPARFTVLTPRLLRLEYAPGGQAEDHASQTFWYRCQPVPPFTVERSQAELVLRTAALTLRYTPGAAFTRKSLSISVHATGQAWHYGDYDPDNLGGTARTLDNADGSVPLRQGLVSRRGWALVDDSHSLVFDDQGWIAPRPHPENLDLYFFAHGHDYLGALADFSAVAGPAPLIPRWALGNWWSRFWEYTQESYKQLVQEFAAHSVPLAVAVIDMDWHITRTGNQSSGWTGYTWNRKLFPDPPAFLAWLHTRGVKTSLNVHPAEGVHPHEQAYPEMARRMGFDPASGEPVAFDIADPRFTEAYFELLHHPQEQDGIDFWWLDWQQGDRTSLPGLDPLYWLNHLHFYDLARGGRRPFIFSRWPGLGGHRYPIGFSGDAVISWASLAFQPYFTATAANVAYGWWSHDIGGHMRGYPEPELYARWVQYGLFSPILRLHSSKNPLFERCPWGYDAETERIASAALRLRHAFIPYLYSLAWRAATESHPLVLPMYYLHPESPEAYRCPAQYWFGSELVAAPYTSRRDPSSGLAQQAVWLPEGEWFDFWSGERFGGNRWLALHGRLEEIPVFARAGAIVPLDEAPIYRDEVPVSRDEATVANGEAPALRVGVPAAPDHLVVHIFPAASNVFELYEDDGDSLAYREGHFAITRLAQSWQGERLGFTIQPAEGDLALLPPNRTWRLVFHGLERPAHVELRLDGEPLPQAQPAWTYAEQAARLEIAGLELAPATRLEVELSGPASLLAERDRRLEKARRMLACFYMDSDLGSELWHALPELLAGRISLLQFASRLTPAQLEALRSVIN